MTNSALILTRHLNTTRQARYPSQILTSELKFPFHFPSHKDASPPHPRFQSPVSCILFLPHAEGCVLYFIFCMVDLAVRLRFLPMQRQLLFVLGSPIHRNSLPRNLAPFSLAGCSCGRLCDAAGYAIPTSSVSLSADTFPSRGRLNAFSDDTFSLFRNICVCRMPISFRLNRSFRMATASRALSS